MLKHCTQDSPHAWRVVQGVFNQLFDPVFFKPFDDPQETPHSVVWRCVLDMFYILY